MSDWSNLTLCPDCGAANPHDGFKCVKCETDLQAALIEDEERRQERIAEKKKSVPSPKATADRKPVDGLTVSDLKRHPVWKYLLSKESSYDETWVTPVKTLPVKDLGNRVVGTEFTMACGDHIYGFMGSVHLNHLKKHQQFMGLTVFKGESEQFHLGRYFDVDYANHGPAALADFLGRSINEIFPLSYDLSSVAWGNSEVIQGSIPADPIERISEDERIDLALQQDKRPIWKFW